MKYSHSQVQLVTWFNSFQLSLMSEIWEQESTKMAAKTVLVQNLNFTVISPFLLNFNTVAQTVNHLMAYLSSFSSFTCIEMCYFSNGKQGLTYQKQHKKSVDPEVKWKVRLFWVRRNVVETKILLLMKESKFSNGYMCGVVVRQRDGMLTLHCLYDRCLYC